jgi:protocatechuate 3,4-dioxygenase beta subunit
MKALPGLVQLIAIIPTADLAQGSIAGRVSDSTGAAVPGVAVEATSDALIETKRTSTTDGAGQYRIEDLRPGAYRVRFTVAGWKPHLREQVEVTAAYRHRQRAACSGRVHRDDHRHLGTADHRRSEREARDHPAQ